MGRKKIEVTKIVDMIAVTPKTKPSDKPIWGGKLERWWNDSTNGKQGIKKIGTNRNFAGKGEKADLSPSLTETLVGFQFKGFEFGNWLSQAERYDVFTAFQSCLIEMAKWLGTQNIGFDHQIGVAFGARGSRGASAHYEALTNMINMTKNYGAGALLHEYAHAIDYSIGAFVDQHIIFSALSGGHHTQQSPNNVGCQFRAMMNKILLYARSTESYKKMLSVPYYKMSISYWGNSTEMFARLTEAYFAYYYNSNHNHYLVKQTEIYEKQSKDYGVYLSKAEMDVIKPEVDKFWKEVASLLNNKCTLRKTPFPKVETESYYIAITFTIKEDWEWRGTKIEKDSHSLYFNREFKSKEDAVRELKKIKEELKKSKVVKKVTLSDNKLDADFLARTGQDTPLLSENITWEIKPGTLSKLDSKYAYDVHFPYWVLEAHKFTLTTDKFLSMAKKIGSEFEKKDAKEKSATSRVYFHKSGMENKASNYIAKHITPNSAKNLLSEIEKLAKKERLIPDRRQTRYGDTVYATVNGIELLFHDTLFSLNKSVKEDKKKEIKKKVEKRPDNVKFDYSKFFDPKNKYRLGLRYLTEYKDFRFATDSFHLVYETLQHPLKEGQVRLFDKKNNLIYDGDYKRLLDVTASNENSTEGREIRGKFFSKYPNAPQQYNVIPQSFTNVLSMDVKERAKLDVASLEKIIKTAKAKAQYNHELDFTICQIGESEVKFKFKTVELIVYVCKKWKVNELLIQNPYRGCKIESSDGSKQALFMPMSCRDLKKDEIESLKKNGYLYVDDLYA